jgi:hypothetical protein
MTGDSAARAYRVAGADEQVYQRRACRLLPVSTPPGAWAGMLITADPATRHVQGRPALVRPDLASSRLPGGVTPGVAPGAVKLELLGGFGLTRLGRPAAVPVSGQRLVAFLALSRHPVRRAYVAGMLWPEVSDERSGEW